MRRWSTGASRSGRTPHTTWALLRRHGLRLAAHRLPSRWPAQDRRLYPGRGPEPEEAPRLTIPDGDARPIPEATPASPCRAARGCKYWNNPAWPGSGSRFPQGAGYRVVRIDQKPVHGAGLVWMHVPHGAEDQTGDRPLAERARWLKHADLFVGLSSGLAWLAWAAGCPTVLISGFTHPTNEFGTPYRVINWHACNRVPGFGGRAAARAIATRTAPYLRGHPHDRHPHHLRPDRLWPQRGQQ